MKTSEIASLGEEEKKEKLGELKQELIKQNAQIATGTVPKSPGQIKNIKKTIARIKTIIGKKKKTDGGDKKQ